MGHTGFEKGQHIEPSPLLLQRATLAGAQLSRGFRAADPKVSDPNGTGKGWERTRGLPWGGWRVPVVPSSPHTALALGQQAQGTAWGHTADPSMSPQGLVLVPRALPAPPERPTEGMCLSQIHRSYVQVSAESETVNYSLKRCPPAPRSTPQR